jgi:hypothetical protein
VPSVVAIAAIAAIAACAAMGGCSAIIGVSGEPVIVDDAGRGSIDEAGSSGGEMDSANANDAAFADETDTGGGGDAGDQDADDGAVE